MLHPYLHAQISRPGSPRSSSTNAYRVQTRPAETTTSPAALFRPGASAVCQHDLSCGLPQPDTRQVGTEAMAPATAPLSTTWRCQQGATAVLHPVSHATAPYQQQQLFAAPTSDADSQARRTSICRATAAPHHWCSARLTLPAALSVLTICTTDMGMHFQTWIPCVPRVLPCPPFAHAAYQSF